MWNLLSNSAHPVGVRSRQTVGKHEAASPVRREWAIGEPPDDFKPHDWGLAFAPDGSDTLDEVLAHLDEMVEKGILSPEERARSEAFYRRSFSE